MRKLSSMRKAQGYYYDENGHLKRKKGRAFGHMNKAKEAEAPPVAKKKAPAKKKATVKKKAAKK